MTLRAPSFRLRKSAKAVLSANGARLAQIAQRVVVFDVRSRSVCCEIKAMKNEWHVAISNDGSTLAVKGENGELAFCDVDTATVLARTPITGLAETGCSPLFSMDGRLLVDGCWDGSIRLWDVASGTEVDRVEHPGFMVTQLAHAVRVDRWFAVLTRIGDAVENRIVTFSGSSLASMQTVEPPLARVASKRGWAQIDQMAVDPAAHTLVLAVVGRTMDERNSILSMQPGGSRCALGELPSRMHFVQGLGCGSGGLAVAAVRENLGRQGGGFRAFLEAQRAVEHSHLHFFDVETMAQLCRWHWKDAWTVGFSEPDLALYVASRDEPGGYLAHHAFDRTAGEMLRASERCRAAVP